MRTSTKDDNDFISEVISPNLLEASIHFIVNKFSAEEIYGRDTLETWALDNGFVSSERESALMDEISDLEAENKALQQELNNIEQ
jgi:phosphatidate phosphatase PAH1